MSLAIGERRESSSWQPSAARRENTNITRFMELVSKDYGIDVSDYASLYQWSIENPSAFWSLFWDFADIKAARKGGSFIA